jgi:predicted nucleic acid-binding protein
VRILVDTSVWSLALRKAGPADHPAVRRLTSLLEDGADVVLTGIILQEVLQAFRSESAFRRMARYLEPFPLLPMGWDDLVAAARLHRRCAANGVTATTVDCQIATAAIRNDCALLTADEDFRRIARVSELRVHE